MTYHTITLEERLGTVKIIFNRSDHKNSITLELLNEINDVLDRVEQNSNIQIIIFEGVGEFFCSGFELKEIVLMTLANNADGIEGQIAIYMSTLKRLSTMPKIVISIIDGAAIAGGVGFVAASDLVIATEKATFNLPEALWGLLPAMVSVYLIRRIGFQKTYMLSLTTQTISAKEAFEMQLIDILSENPEECLGKMMNRLFRLEEMTIHKLKAFFRKMWIVDDEREKLAVEESASLFLDPKVQANLRNFVEREQLPWEHKKHLGHFHK